MLELDILNAKQGDCFILRYGKNETSGLVVFDGGAAGTWKNHLHPRLEVFADTDGQTKLEKVIVTHIDDDHIRGILDMMKSIRQQQADLNINSFWFNSFTDLTEGLIASNQTRLTMLASSNEFIQLAQQHGFHDDATGPILASINQGDTLTRDLVELNIYSPDLIFNGQTEQLKFLTADNGLHEGPLLTVLGPLPSQLEDLKQQWNPEWNPTEMAAYLDQSVPNLSSIAVLVEYEGKCLLMTGDIRGDHLLEGLLKANKIAHPEEHIHVDVLKVAHHGSSRNVSPEFFTQITADTYVISANGRHHNPDHNTLTWLVESRHQNDEYTILFSSEMKTEDAQTALMDHLTALQQNRQFTFLFRPNEKSGLTWPSQASF